VIMCNHNLVFLAEVGLVIVHYSLILANGQHQSNRILPNVYSFMMSHRHFILLLFFPWKL